METRLMQQCEYQLSLSSLCFIPYNGGTEVVERVGGVDMCAIEDRWMGDGPSVSSDLSRANHDVVGPET